MGLSELVQFSLVIQAITIFLAILEADMILFSFALILYIPSRERSFYCYLRYSIWFYIELNLKFFKFIVVTLRFVFLAKIETYSA